MHISKEFLMEAVGLSLLVALIFISTQMFQRATEVTGRLERWQEEKMIQIEEYELARYDGMKVDGMTAIGCIKTAVGEYQLPVAVTTGNGRFVVDKKETYTGLRDIDSDYYINPLALYQCKVVRDENGSLTEMEIRIVSSPA